MIHLSAIAFGLYCLLYLPVLDDGLPPQLLAPVGSDSTAQFPSITQQDVYEFYRLWGIEVEQLRIVASIPIAARCEQRQFMPLLGDSEKQSQTEIIIWMETWDGSAAIKAARIERVRFRLLKDGAKPGDAP